MCVTPCEGQWVGLQPIILLGSSLYLSLFKLSFHLFFWFLARIGLCIDHQSILQCEKQHLLYNVSSINMLKQSINANHCNNEVLITAYILCSGLISFFSLQKWFVKQIFPTYHVWDIMLGAPKWIWPEYHPCYKGSQTGGKEKLRKQNLIAIRSFAFLALQMRSPKFMPKVESTIFYLKAITICLSIFILQRKM